MNSHKKYEILKTGIEDYMHDIALYGNDISTLKVISDLNKVLKKVDK